MYSYLSIDERNADSLLSFIQAIVRFGFVVYTDEWWLYRKLQGLNFNNRTVSHPVNIDDLINVVCLQPIQFYWKKHKA